jgi:hypothetical protein
MAAIIPFHSASQKNAPDSDEMKAVNDTFGDTDDSPEEVQRDREHQTAARGALAALKSENSTPLRSLVAPILLSLAKRTALIECFNNNRPHKSRGHWCGTPNGMHISGMTVADLARDGMFTVTTNRLEASARLTKRGQWLAQALVEAEN